MTDLDRAQRAQEALRLCWAAHKQGKELPQAKVKDLVKQGVDVHVTDNSGWTLLHWTANFLQQELCELLIQ